MAPAAVRDSCHGCPSRRCGQTSNVCSGSSLCENCDVAPKDPENDRGAHKKERPPALLAGVGVGGRYRIPLAKTIVISGSIERKGSRTDTKVYGARPQGQALPQWVQKATFPQVSGMSALLPKPDVAHLRVHVTSWTCPGLRSTQCCAAEPVRKCPDSIGCRLCGAALHAAPRRGQRGLSPARQSSRALRAPLIGCVAGNFSNPPVRPRSPDSRRSPCSTTEALGLDFDRRIGACSFTAPSKFSPTCTSL